MSASNPSYVYQLPKKGKTLTDEQLADLLELLEYSGHEMLTDTDGRLITHTSGAIIYGKD